MRLLRDGLDAQGSTSAVKDCLVCPREPCSKGHKEMGTQSHGNRCVDTSLEKGIECNWLLRICLSFGVGQPVRNC